MTGRWLRNSFIYLLILVGVIAIVFTLIGTGGGSSKEDATQADFVADVRADKAEEIERDGDTVTYR